MTVREATEADAATVRELVEAYQDEFWERPYPAPPVPDSWVREGRILLAERDGAVEGMAKGELRHGGGHVSLVYLRPEARRQGLGKELLRALVPFFREAGVEQVTLGVDLSNEQALAVWRRLGFVEIQRILSADLAALESRLAQGGGGTSVGSVHVQTDDQSAIERAVARFVRRLFVSPRSVVAAPRNGWVAVYDAVASGDPQSLRQLARELSHITGGVVLSLGVEDGAVVRAIAFERGSMMDEYLSDPHHYGPLPPGDAVALRANPTVLARLTGGDAGAIRAAARQAAPGRDLPAATDLLDQVASALGIDGAGIDVDEAATRDGAVTVEHS